MYNSLEKIDKEIYNIITENKSGRLAYKVQSVVDATGDCDIANGILYYNKYEEEFGEEFTKLKRKRVIPFIY